MAAGEGFLAHFAKPQETVGMFDHAKDQPSVQSLDPLHGGYLLGASIERFARPVGTALTVAVVIGAVIGFFLVRKS